MKCPHCKKKISDKIVAKHFASKGGASGKGESKARTSEQASAAVKARWERYYKEHPEKAKKTD